MMYSLLSAHLAIAASVTVLTFHRGMLDRPFHRLITATEYILGLLACVGIGLVWPLFVPGLLVVLVRGMVLRIRSWRRQVLLSRTARASS
ncbi:MAG: hypothetical protein LBG44_11735 [Gemmatimonadota bacterium]|nr:hypothetical protein [Gemmatimonadota bacterium]